MILAQQRIQGLGLGMIKEQKPDQEEGTLSGSGGGPTDTLYGGSVFAFGTHEECQESY